jgi:hypothetical protein
MITLHEATYTFVRPADVTAYTAADLVANSTTAGSVVPLSWSLPSNVPVFIPAFRMTINNPIIANASFRLHLLHTIPTFTSAGDNSIVSTVVATGHAFLLAAYSGTLSTVTADGCSGLLVPADGGGRWLPMRKKPTATVQTTLYGYLEATAAYVPSSGASISLTMILAKKD